MSRRRDWLIVSVAKAVVGALVLSTGFRAISDDDFARIVIAERFAATPSLDPSGTSWLPAPFWVYGGALAVFGRDLQAARMTAIALGVLAAVVVYEAGHWIHRDRFAALSGALVAAIFPLSAVLGVATVPEAPTAALGILGTASLVSHEVQPDVRKRWIGAATLCIATLCRYEAWPLAAIFLLFTLYDAVRAGRWTLAGPALLSALGSLAWIAHGVAHHGNALFFVHRVSAYRQALSSSSVESSAFATVARWLLSEPEVSLMALAAALWLLGKNRTAVAAFFRPAAATTGKIGFLVVGALLDGAATHHGERALLGTWFLCALLIGQALSVARNRWSSVHHLRFTATTTMIVAASVALRSQLKIEPYVDRAPEVAMGSAARAKVAKSARLLVDTDDYGYFAVIAAFGAPERAEPLHSHDPRDAAATHSSEATLERTARKLGATYVIAPVEAEPQLRPLGAILTRNARLILVRTLPRK